MANEAYINAGTSILINGEASADVDFDVQGLTDGNGHISAQRDWGAPPQPFMYEWICECQFQATGLTQYGTLDLYVSEAPDGFATEHTGDPNDDTAPVNEALAQVDMVQNMKWIGAVVVEVATANVVMRASGVFESTFRYHAYVALNNSGASLHATDSNFIWRVKPIYVQGQ